MVEQETLIERIHATGDQLVEKVEALLHEGNVRRIVIKQEEHTVAEFPLTAGVVGAVLAPMLAAIAALAVVLNHCTIELEREESHKQQGSARTIPGLERGTLAESWPEEPPPDVDEMPSRTEEDDVAAPVRVAGTGKGG